MLIGLLVLLNILALAQPIKKRERKARRRRYIDLYHKLSRPMYYCFETDSFIVDQEAIALRKRLVKKIGSCGVKPWQTVKEFYRTPPGFPGLALIYGEIYAAL